MSITLAPITHKDAYTRAVEKEVIAWMREAVWTPLLIELFNAGVPVDPQYQAIKFDEEGARANAGATSAVRAALESGQIHYADGKFTGRFSVAISKELRTFGATFNAGQKTWSIAQSRLPLTLSSSITESIAKSRHLHEDVIQTLVQMQANIAVAPVGLGLALSQTVDRVIIDAGRQFIASVATKGIGIPAEFTPAMRKQLTEQLTANLDLGIKGWAEERIPQLRRRVEENVFNGMRSDKLARIIEAEFGVSKRKAEFLADQETGLLMAKYRQARYEDIGVQDYIWETSHDSRVRPGHRALQGKRCSFANPPVEDPQTGHRANPGIPWRCRCVPRAIVNLVPS